MTRQSYAGLMPHALHRFHHSGQSHFITVSCFHRQPNFNSSDTCDLFLRCLEDMRRYFSLCVYGYVVMPEHVHLLVSETPQMTIADSMRFLKLTFAKRLHARSGNSDSNSFWQKRYYDRNVRDAREFSIKLRYLHRNPVKRGLAKDPADWKWSSYRHYALRENGVVEIESDWTARDREAASRGEPERIF